MSEKGFSIATPFRALVVAGMFVPRERRPVQRFIVARREQPAGQPRHGRLRTGHRRTSALAQRARRGLRDHRQPPRRPCGGAGRWWTGGGAHVGPRRPRGQGGYGGGAFAWVPDGRALVVAAAGDLWLVPRTAGRPGGSPSTVPMDGWAHRRWRLTAAGSPTPATCEMSPSCPWPTAPHGRCGCRAEPTSRPTPPGRATADASCGRRGTSRRCPGTRARSCRGQRWHRPHRAGARHARHPIVAGTTIPGGAFDHGPAHRWFRMAERHRGRA